MLRAKQGEKLGFLSIFFTQSNEPLGYWTKQVMSGRIKRVIDDSDKIKLQVLELVGNNVQSTYITTPTSEYSSLGITLPVLVLIVKNLKRYFFYQVQILDDKNFRRRFRLTNIPGFNRKLPTVCTFPITLEEGWNELATNLAELTQRAYNTNYVETIRVEIHANCRIREIFFCENMDAMQVRIQRPTLSEGNNLSIDEESNLTNINDPVSISTSLNYDPTKPTMSDDDDNNKNKTGTNHIQDAVKTMKEYEELAKRVKNYAKSTVSSNSFSQAIVSRMEEDEKVKESKSKPNSTGGGGKGKELSKSSHSSLKSKKQKHNNNNKTPKNSK